MAKATTYTSTVEEPNADQIVNSILQLAYKEQNNGNKSITQEKLDNLTKFVLKQKSERGKSSTTRRLQTSGETSKYSKLVKNSYSENTSYKGRPLPQIPLSTFSPIYHKFDPQAYRRSTKPRTATSNNTTTNNNLYTEFDNKPRVKKFGKIGGETISFQKIERTGIAILESIASIIDNLHLISHLPMFPKILKKLLRNTNKLWILILIFLTRKTISQLLNVIRKERKIQAELDIVKDNGSKVLFDYDDKDYEQRRDDENNENKHGQPINIFRKYEKILKDLKFDKMMLKFELVGNLLDLSFNLIEFYRLVFPDWFMGILNTASMAMTIYRMNKDDEYLDDDITEDLI